MIKQQHDRVDQNPQIIQALAQQKESLPVGIRRRGRPPGSLNKVKIAKANLIESPSRNNIRMREIQEPLRLSPRDNLRRLFDLARGGA